jgi:hypothetical protein
VLGKKPYPDFPYLTGVPKVAHLAGNFAFKENPFLRFNFPI